MSITYELHKSIGKRPCLPGFPRAKRCPMIINEVSEDLFMSNTFTLLKYLTPTIWLIPFLNIVFKGRDFRKLCHGSPKIEFWKRLRSPVSFSNREGTEELDIVITIGQAVILVECKYRSPVQPEAVGHRRDQIIRYLDAAVFNYWPDFEGRAEVLFILLTDTEDEPPVLSQYRNPNKILQDLTKNLPSIDYEQVSEALAHNVAWARWTDILQVLKGQDLKKVNPIEAMIIADLIKYLRYKLQTIKRTRHRQEGGDSHV